MVDRIKLPDVDGMGYEYVVRYTPADEGEWQSLVERLVNPVSNGWPAFTVEKMPYGIYFCDHAHSSEAAVALRRIIDEALAHGDSVELTEP